MMRSNIRTGWRLMLAAGLLGVGFAHAQGQRDNARYTFFKSIAKGGTVNATLVQTKRVSDDNKSVVKFSVVMNSQGWTRRTVVQPLSMEGTILIDDGKNWTTIEPEKREAVIQPSPLKDKLDPKLRMRLIDTNYTLRSDGEDKIAGRKALIVRAVPKDKDMAERRYGIDVENYVLLRIETADGEGNFEVMIDTVAATFPREIDPGMFEVDTSGYRVKRTDYPKPIKDLGAARQTLGFAPRIPEAIPYGFRITQEHLVGGDERQFLALRLSDGLSVVTVYQWDGSRKYSESPFLRSRDASDEEGICYKVVGDVPRNVRKKLAQIFRESAKVVLDGRLFEAAPPRPVAGPPTQAGGVRGGLRRGLNVAPECPPPPIVLPPLPGSDRERGIGIEQDPRFDLVLVTRRS